MCHTDKTYNVYSRRDGLARRLMFTTQSIDTAARAVARLQRGGWVAWLEVA